MSNQRWRDEFLVTVGAAGMRPDVARRMLRYSATLHRLAEAQCNGDWPADNGERKTEECAACATFWAPSVLLKGKRCPDCRTSELVREHLPEGWGVEFQGDPRGCVVKLKTPQGREVGVP